MPLLHLHDPPVPKCVIPFRNDVVDHDENRLQATAVTSASKLICTTINKIERKYGYKNFDMRRQIHPHTHTLKSFTRQIGRRAVYQNYVPPSEGKLGFRETEAKPSKSLLPSEGDTYFWYTARGAQFDG
jgi:hypothetical protein